AGGNRPDGLNEPVTVSLPLSVFNPQDYHPLLITVSGKNVN
ncbi:TPA: hypothetical protein ACP2QJ_005127, partial [Escherichia coli]